MRRKLIAGNWKMHGNLASNAELLSGILAGLGPATCDVAVCVPAPYLSQCESLLSASVVAWGAQDVSEHVSGAFTGEVSGDMLKDFGCRYAIVGHSERRAYHRETNEVVGRKVVRALSHGLTPIVCVGETLAERDEGRTTEVVSAQLATVLSSLRPESIESIVVAYEPVWAIGSGRTATPEMAQEVHATIRKLLIERHPSGEGVRILYGGSMKPDNARQLLAMPDVDGGLIGGASLKAADFLAIIHSA